MRTFSFTVFWTIVIDQLTKFLVVEMMDLKTLGQIDVVPGFLSFRMAWNRGVNFGLFSSLDMKWVLIAVALAISVAVTTWVFRSGQPRRVNIAAGLLVGGAIGNVIDRLHYGAVADFLNVTCCGIYNPFAFNVADIAIFVGALAVVIFSNPKAAEKASGKK